MLDGKPWVLGAWGFFCWVGWVGVGGEGGFGLADEMIWLGELAAGRFRLKAEGHQRLHCSYSKLGQVHTAARCSAEVRFA